MKVTIEETKQTIQCSDLYTDGKDILMIIQLDGNVYGSIYLSESHKGELYHSDKRTLKQLEEQLHKNEFKLFHGKVILEQ